MARWGDVCREGGEQLLLVEGKDDCHVVMALLKAQSVDRSFGIYECGSLTKVLRQLNALIKAPDAPARIGVVLDADLDGVSVRWQSVRDKLGRHSYRFPAVPERHGTIVEGDGREPRLGVWIMPDNESEGAVEDFCLGFLRESHVAVAREAVELAREREVATFRDGHESKALIHTYLAWQDEPGRPMGQAISRHLLPSTADNAGRFLRWLQALFDA